MSKGDSYPFFVWSGLLTPEHRKKMGGAVWVFLWCVDKTTQEEDDIGEVLGGREVKAAEIGADLGYHKNSVLVSLARLNQFDYITLVEGRYGFKIWVGKKETPGLCNNEKERRSRERSKLKPGMRYDVMKRDGFKCCICGATSTDESLVVDHIKPISKGGKTKMDNLQTLCNTCNSGKGAKFDG